MFVCVSHFSLEKYIDWPNGLILNSSIGSVGSSSSDSLVGSHLHCVQRHQRQ